MKRLGVQTLGFSQAVVDAVRRGRPSVYKFVNPDKGWVEKIAEVSPTTTLVGRLVDVTLAGKLSADEGVAFADRVLQKAGELSGLIRWWEGSNEAAKAEEAIKRLTEFERAFAERIQAEGYHALVGGFSSGTPEIVKPGVEGAWMGRWELFYPALEVAHGAHFHEYWEPHNLDSTWHARRFTHWWPELPDALKNKWWLVSELGVDGGLEGLGRKGWAAFDHVPPEKYLGLLRGYAETLEEYPHMAATIYTAGLGMDPSWATFDIKGPVLQELAEGWNQAPEEPWGVPAVLKPGKEYKPQPFDFHYVLLGQSEDEIVPWAWVEALQKYLKRFRVTLGFSHDHAAMATPFTKTRHVTLIGSSDAEVNVSEEVGEILRTAGCEIDRVPGTTAKAIKEEMDRRAETGFRFGQPTEPGDEEGLG